MAHQPASELSVLPVGSAAVRRDRRVAPGAWALASLCVAGVLSIGTWSGMLTLPGAVAGVTSPAVERDLAAIAAAPRPVGSGAAASARGYIVNQLTAAGLQPDVRAQSYVSVEAAGGSFRAGQVRNIVARTRGSASTKAVLLMAHYDSVRYSAGAADNAVGVVALLEAVRLAARTALRNDVIALFTDGEEIGQLGVKAFVERHPWARDVGLVVNLDARGNTGPSMLFETGDQDGWAVRVFGSSVPEPIGNSFAPLAYRWMPNTTDFSIFRNARVPGLNFAFFEGWTAYHAPTDTADHLDRRSLAQTVANASALVEAFGRADLSHIAPERVVYFDIFGRWLIVYSPVVAMAASVVLVGLFILAIRASARESRLTWPGALLGVVAIVCAVVVSGLVSYAAGQLFRAYREAAGYAAPLLAAALAASTMVVTWCVYAAFARVTSWSNLAVGALAWWVLLSLAMAWFALGASYLFVWPAATALLAWVSARLAVRPGARRGVWLSIVIVSSLPLMVVWPPLLRALYAALPSRDYIVSGIAALCLGLLAAHVRWVPSRRSWIAGSALASVALVLWAAAWRAARFDAEHPRADFVAYVLNADDTSAVWMTDRIDAWSSQFFKKATSAPAPFVAVQRWYSGMRFGRQFAGAPALPLQPPAIVVLSDARADGRRILRLLVTSARRAPEVAVRLASTSPILESSVDGHTTPVRPTRDAIVVTYFDPREEGFVVGLTTDAHASITAQLIDRSYTLPTPAGFSITPRPRQIVSAGDTTLITRSASF